MLMTSMMLPNTTKAKTGAFNSFASEIIWRFFVIFQSFVDNAIDNKSYQIYQQKKYTN